MTSTARDWINALPSEGRYTFTRQDVEAASGASFVAVQSTLRRLHQQGAITCPHRGFYVVVPVEYRATKSPPASWFIDDLMKHLSKRYYVALLSAAALHGAAHQQPMVFQVITDGTVRSMSSGLVRIQPHASRLFDGASATRVQTETGSMAVSTAETTAFDLVRFPRAAGHWNNIATVMAELAERLHPDRLLEQVSRVAQSDVQRLGWLLSFLDQYALAAPLADWLSKRRTTTTRLRVDRLPLPNATDSRWNLNINETVEPDL